jgi:hypothetical protein
VAGLGTGGWHVSGRCTMLTQRDAANQRSRTDEFGTPTNRHREGPAACYAVASASRRAGPTAGISAHELSSTTSEILFMVTPAGGPILHCMLVGKTIKALPMGESSQPRSTRGALLPSMQHGTKTTYMRKPDYQSWFLSRHR